MNVKIMPLVIALICISTHALGDEVDDRFQKARKYLNDSHQADTITDEQPTPKVPAQVVGEGTLITWMTPADSLRGKNGLRVAYLCPAGGMLSERLWGTDLYTDDSSICSAAVHAGLVTTSGGGPITIEIRPGASTYTGSSRNGVASRGYGGWHGSFVFVSGSVSPPVTENDQFSKSQTKPIESSWNVGGLTSGVMVLRQSGTTISGNYPEDRGEIVGTKIENILTGYWIEDASGQRCTTPKNDRYFWGRIRVVFNGNRFSGTWGYCEAEPMTPWSGTR
jgi:hypothetical protein